MTIKHDVPLASYTSLKVGGPAKTLIELEAGDNLRDVLRELHGQQVWVLGYGTNSLIPDAGLPGTVIMNHAQQIELIDDTRIKASSGTDWDDLVEFAIQKQLYGLEFTSGIPGGVGAAIVGNIAAYGCKVADTFVEVTLLDTTSGQVLVWGPDELEFSYRTSSLQKPEHKSLVVLDATFELSALPLQELEYDSALQVAQKLGIPADSLENRRRIILETRKHAGSILSDRKHGPWTAGSFFKNPMVNAKQVDAIVSFDEAGVSREKLLRQNQLHSGDKVRVSAAHVLLAAGFKRGQKWGNVRLHPEHVLKLENTGNATASEMHAVVQKIIKTVDKKLKIKLQPEVQILGKF